MKHYTCLSKEKTTINVSITRRLSGRFANNLKKM